MPPKDALNRQSLADQIKGALLERILSGQLKPGERLVELKIADEMQTSQAPVREALRELEAMGIIDVQRNKGARVRVIDEKEQAEIYAVRAELEGYGTELAAQAGAALADELERHIDDMRICAKDQDHARFADANSQFHLTIMTAAGNETLLDLWRRLDVRTRTMVNVSRKASDLTRIAESHTDIVDQIRKRDAGAARQAAEDHVRGNAPVSLAAE